MWLWLTPFQCLRHYFYIYITYHSHFKKKIVFCPPSLDFAAPLHSQTLSHIFWPRHIVFYLVLSCFLWFSSCLLNFFWSHSTFCYLHWTTYTVPSLTYTPYLIIIELDSTPFTPHLYHIPMYIAHRNWLYQNFTLWDHYPNIWRTLANLLGI